MCVIRTTLTSGILLDPIFFLAPSQHYLSQVKSQKPCELQEMKRRHLVSVCPELIRSGSWVATSYGNRHHEKRFLRSRLFHGAKSLRESTESATCPTLKPRCVCGWGVGGWGVAIVQHWICTLGPDRVAVVLQHM